MFKRAFNASVARHINRDFLKAVKRDDLATAHMLLTSELIDVNMRKDITSIFTAARSDQSAIRYAIDNDSRPMLELLIKHGADINQKIIDGFFEMGPAHYAAEHGKANCLKVILDHPDIDLERPFIMDDDAPFLEPLYIHGIDNYASDRHMPAISKTLIQDKVDAIKKAAEYASTACKKFKR